MPDWPEDLIEAAAYEVRQVRIRRAAEDGINLDDDNIFNSPADPNGIKEEVRAVLATIDRRAQRSLQVR